MNRNYSNVMQTLINRHYLCGYEMNCKDTRANYALGGPSLPAGGRGPGGLGNNWVAHVSLDGTRLGGRRVKSGGIGAGEGRGLDEEGQRGGDGLCFGPSLREPSPGHGLVPWRLTLLAKGWTKGSAALLDLMPLVPSFQRHDSDAAAPPYWGSQKQVGWATVTAPSTGQGGQTCVPWPAQLSSAGASAGTQLFLQPPEERVAPS